MLNHVLREIAANVAMGIPAIRDRRTKRRRTSYDDLDVQVRQMRDQFAFFAGCFNPRGKVIAEIGPGDAIALGAQFLKAGASRYFAFDRWRGDIYGPRAKALYRALECDIDPAKFAFGGAIEEVTQRAICDVVISFDVIEHLRDPLLAIERMRRILKPGGIMVHRIDYGPHDVWTTYADPLTFLRIPKPLWHAMGSNRGYPNRVRHGAIMAALPSPVDRVTRRFQDGSVWVAEVACGCALGPAFPY